VGEEVGAAAAGGQADDPEPPRGAPDDVQRLGADGSGGTEDHHLARVGRGGVLEELFGDSHPAIVPHPGGAPPRPAGTSRCRALYKEVCSALRYRRVSYLTVKSCTARGTPRAASPEGMPAAPPRIRGARGHRRDLGGNGAVPRTAPPPTSPVSARPAGPE